MWRTHMDGNLWLWSLLLQNRITQLNCQCTETAIFTGNSIIIN